MASCPTCGNDNKQGAKFCRACGCALQSTGNSESFSVVSVGAEEKVSTESAVPVSSSEAGGVRPSSRLIIPIVVCAAIVVVAVCGTIIALNMNHSNQNTGGGANTATVDTPSSQTEEPASGQGDTAGVAPQEETNANNGSSSGQDSTTQGGSSSSTDELHSGKPADDYAPAGGFWGIWTAASKNEDVLAKPFGKLASAGYPTCVITTSKWSNLNPETWYAVCSGPYSSEAEAKSKLAEVRSVSGDDSAYVKWSGTRK